MSSTDEEWLHMTRRAAKRTRVAEGGPGLAVPPVFEVDLERALVRAGNEGATSLAGRTDEAGRRSALLAVARAAVEAGEAVQLHVPPLDGAATHELLVAEPQGDRAARVLLLPLRWTFGHASDSDGLTPREREVLDLLIAGTSLADIAAQLGIASNTVRTYLKRLYRFFGVTSRAELVGRLVRELVPSVEGVRRDPGGRLDAPPGGPTERRRT